MLTLNATFFAHVQLFPILRLGAWYTLQAAVSVHFKSTDGHRGVWQLALRRLNLHLADLVLQHSVYSTELQNKPHSSYPAFRF